MPFSGLSSGDWREGTPTDQAGLPPTPSIFEIAAYDVNRSSTCRDPKEQTAHCKETPECPGDRRSGEKYSCSYTKLGPTIPATVVREPDNQN